MKKCPFCSASNYDFSTVCEKCKLPFGLEAKLNRKNRSVQTAAKVFLVIATISLWLSTLVCWIMWFALITSLKIGLTGPSILMLVALLSLLVYTVIVTCMTCSYFNKTALNIRVGVGFKVCTLIFVSFIAGILMFCDNDESLTVLPAEISEGVRTICSYSFFPHTASPPPKKRH